MFADVCQALEPHTLYVLDKYLLNKGMMATLELIGLLIHPQDVHLPYFTVKEPHSWGCPNWRSGSRRGAGSVPPTHTHTPQWPAVPCVTQSRLYDMPQPRLPALSPRARKTGVDPASAGALLKPPPKSIMRALCFDFLSPARRKRM